MKIIIGNRGSGKTTELIKHCASNNGVIVCPTKISRKYVIETAKRLGLENDIQQPITFAEFVSGEGIDKDATYYFDEIEYCLKSIAPKIGGISCDQGGDCYLISNMTSDFCPYAE